MSKLNWSHAKARPTARHFNPYRDEQEAAAIQAAKSTAMYAMALRGMAMAPYEVHARKGERAQIALRAKRTTVSLAPVSFVQSAALGG